MAKAKKPIEPRCDNCAFYAMHDESQGFCRRYPPCVPQLHTSEFPPVKAETYCGEFKPASMRQRIWTV